MKVKLLDPTVKPPVRSSEAAAGYDLHLPVSHGGPPSIWSAGGATIAPGAFVKLNLQIAIQLEPGEVAILHPRSSMAARGVDVLGGVIDSDYRGPIGLVLINHSTVSIELAPGDRVAQLVVFTHSMRPVEVVAELDSTERGAGGFGSTGR